MDTRPYGERANNAREVARVKYAVLNDADGIMCLSPHALKTGVGQSKQGVIVAALSFQSVGMHRFR